MFRKSKRQLKDVTFVQPLKGEVYFCTPIACSTYFGNSEEKEGKQVFKDSDLALAGKLKLIFEREKMIWFEIKEEKSASPSNKHVFALYYYPQRLLASRSFEFNETATLQNIKEMFDFIVTERQTRSAEVKKTQPTSAYTPLIISDLSEESDTIHMVIKESCENLEVIPKVEASEKH